MPNRSHTTHVETFTGEFIDYLNPRPQDIKLEDIARGLSQTVRFTGQTSRWYSVAEHAVRVSWELQKHHAVHDGGGPVDDHYKSQQLYLAGLHHDSHEAYITDLPSPFKWAAEQELPGFAEWLERMRLRLDSAIGRALGIVSEMMHDGRVKFADDDLMYREAATLKYSHGIGQHWGNTTRYTPMAGIGWSADKAERLFLKEHFKLTEAAS